MYNKKAIKCYEEGRALQQTGRLAGAERAYKKAIKINQGFIEAHNDLGNVLLDLGRAKEAAHAFRKALKLRPDHPMLLTNLGSALQLQGETETAIDWFNKAIIHDPNFLGAHINLGNALRDLGRFQEAVVSYEKAIQIDPGFADTYNNLGSVLIELDELDDAVTNLTKAIELDPRHIEAYNGLGNALSGQGEIDKAIAAYRKAIEINPTHSDAHNGLGNVLSDMGEIEKAIASYRRAIEIRPGNSDIYRSLSKLKKFTEYDDDIRAMETLYAIENIPDVQKMHLAFGLGKAYEDLGEYEKSMDFILLANRLKRASFEYSISEAEDIFGNIKAIFSSEFFALLSLTRKIPTADTPAEFPGCIVDLDSKALDELGKEYITGIRHYSEEAEYISDKMPHNFLRIGLIKVILPNARIINCNRDQMDNCLSLLKNYFSKGHAFSYDMTELGQYYNLYLDLMEHWRDTLPGFIYDLSYETLVADQENQIRALLDFCNLPWDDACLDFHNTRRKVRTASNAQVRRPIYKDSVKLWKRYERQLQPLRTAIDG
jgi:tetratricopeptide (TPR) repeat protein